jgi:hypothetical protein
MLPFMTPQTLLQLINERHGTAFALGERFVGGEQGAFAVVDSAGKRFALKWRAAARVAPFLQSRDVVEMLRDRGYPAPRYAYEGTIAGVAYGIQEVLPGIPLGWLEARYLPCLLELNALQAGLAPHAAKRWRGMLVHSSAGGLCGLLRHRDAA